ncbi:hypothetical protein OsI_31511 [Oryza sativa Indica Group]|uniref:Uncharacterized protein n=1 Tax=Oryza sativa subsp. indica TaxID=39946 RepID=A2Z1M7_ORYSI|nr:hypothetical protein OsI_31511 [Oryza sativa Indica Group]
MVGMLPETNAQAAAEEVLGDAWDYRGRPAARSRTGRWGAAAMILVAELNERLTTLGIAVNLVTYLTATMHAGNAEAANVVTNFMGTSFMLCLLGGFVADSFLGRYLTIAIFTAVQASDNLGRPWGYGACAAAIAAGLVVFLAGTRRYRFKKLVGSPLTQIAAVVVAAWRKRRLELPSDPAMLYDIDVGKLAAAEVELAASSKKSKLKQRLPHTKQFR